MSEEHRLALTYRSSVERGLRRRFQAQQHPAGLPGRRRAAISRPRSSSRPSLALGYGFQASDKLRIDADVEWIGFSDYDVLPLDAGANTPLLPAPAIPQDWDDIWTFGLGADWQFSDELTLRAGYIFIESPIPDETFSPTLPDADRHVLSVGLGYEQGAHTPRRWPTRTASSTIGTSRTTRTRRTTGSTDITSHLLGVSYALHFLGG